MGWSTEQGTPAHRHTITSKEETVNNQLAIPSQSEWTIITDMAERMFKSGLLPKSINSPFAAVAIFTLGREIGISPWQAVSTINVIAGKPTISPQLMLALIKRSGLMEDMKIEVTDESATVTMKRKGETAHVEVFSMVDAKAMQTTEYVNNVKQTISLSEKHNWKSQPKTMMKWRAVAACARVVFPDVILGLYTPEEMGADVQTDDSGNMTVVTVTPEPAPQLPSPAPASGPTLTVVGEAKHDPKDLTIRVNAEAFARHWYGKGMSRNDILKALQVEGITKWERGWDAADEAMHSYIEAGLATEKAEAADV
jgi:hypothetical protein